MHIQLNGKRIKNQAKLRVVTQAAELTQGLS
jgi:hypothetical protein